MPGSDTRREREGELELLGGLPGGEGWRARGRTSAERRVDGVLDGGAEVKGRQQWAWGFGLRGGGFTNRDTGRGGGVQSQIAFFSPVSPLALKVCFVLFLTQF